MSTMKKTFKRSGSLAALLVLVMALIAPVAGATPQSEATEWLSSQLKSPKAGEKYCELFGGPSVGQTIDCMLAFDAETGFESQENETWAWILANKSSYVGSEPCSTASSMSAGAVAKLALGAEAHGVDPMNVGGRDLIADLQCLQVSKAGAEQGRFKDKGATDFSNVFGQSLAIIALKGCEKGRCASPPSLTTTLNRAASYLRGQQCTEHKEEKVKGAFRSAMGLEAGTCENKTPFPSETEFNENAIDIDSTGFAIEALWQHGNAASKSAAEAAGTWMYNERIVKTGPPKRLNWQSYCSFSEPKVKFDSVNSTALAIMGAAEIKLEVTAAREWLADAVASGENRGMPACGATGNGDVLATAQGILGLNGASYPILVGL
jgi:hypothetical protein